LGYHKDAGSGAWYFEVIGPTETGRFRYFEQCFYLFPPLWVFVFNLFVFFSVPFVELAPPVMEHYGGAAALNYAWVVCCNLLAVERLVGLYDGGVVQLGSIGALLFRYCRVRVGFGGPRGEV
jgi:hypothetical protein